MAKQIIVGLFIAGMGGALVYFSSFLAYMFGHIAWFERNLGGTRSGLILFGFGFMVIGFLILFGMIPTNSPTENLAGFGSGTM